MAAGHRGACAHGPLADHGGVEALHVRHLAAGKSPAASDVRAGHAGGAAAKGPGPCFRMEILGKPSKIRENSRKSGGSGPRGVRLGRSRHRLRLISKAGGSRRRSSLWRGQELRPQGPVECPSPIGEADESPRELAAEGSLSPSAREKGSKVKGRG